MSEKSIEELKKELEEAHLEEFLVKRDPEKYEQVREKIKKIRKEIAKIKVKEIEKGRGK